MDSLKNRKILAVAMLIISILAATFTFYFWQVTRTANLNVKGEKPFALLIPTGGTYKNVSDTLAKYDLIQERQSFAFLSKFMKYPELVKPGRYLIEPKMGNRAFLLKLRAGEQDPLKLTFNNVRLKEDLVRKIGDKLEFKGGELETALNSPEYCQKYGFTTDNIMSIFLPNTYQVTWNTTVDKFMERMYKEHQRYWTDVRIAKAKEIGLTPNEVSILASVVQGETNKIDEKPRVAGAYMNRLKQNMPLQADPTVVFAWKDFTIKRLLNRHLSIDSPYNTYRVTGLPPGPINLPELSSLDAVLNYEQHKYIYFCAKEDFSGYHNFAETLPEHNRNAKIYQEALNQRNIKK